jgi:hypothetical protein
MVCPACPNRHGLYIAPSPCSSMGLETVDLPEHNAAVHAPTIQNVEAIVIRGIGGSSQGVRYIARPTISEALSSYRRAA